MSGLVGVLVAMITSNSALVEKHLTKYVERVNALMWKQASIMSKSLVKSMSTTQKKFSEVNVGLFCVSFALGFFIVSTVLLLLLRMGRPRPLADPNSTTDNLKSSTLLHLSCQQDIHYFQS